MLLKCHGRSSKHDPMVEEVDLVHATPNYAVVRFPSGKESTVLLKYIAPAGSSREDNSGEIEPCYNCRQGGARRATAPKFCMAPPKFFRSLSESPTRPLTAPLVAKLAPPVAPPNENVWFRP